MVVPSPFPWTALERCDGAAVLAASGARHALDALLDPARIGEIASSLLGLECSLVVHRVQAAAAIRDLPAVRVAMSAADGSAEWVVGLDPGLVMALVARLLGRSLPIEAPRSPVGPELQGAAEAVLLELGRRLTTHGSVALQLADTVPSGPGLSVLGSVLAAGRPFPFGAFVRWRTVSAPAPAAEQLVARLGALRLALPLIVGEGAATWRDLSALAPGDAWSCGEGLWIDRDRVGRGVLAAPTATQGLAVSLAAGERVVLLGERRGLALDAGGIDVNEDVKTEDIVTEAILDAPLVVRVEMGAVAMSAREWTELRPGDVIRTDRRIAAPVVLRVGGREVATGELVEIDGDLAVRILSLTVPAGTP